MKIENYIKHHKEVKLWKMILLILSSVVCFVTIALMTKPATTMEGTLICEIEGHEHVASCYAEEIVENTYSCGLYEHIHHEDCYSDTSELICLQIEHIHNAECQPVTESVSENDNIENLIVSEEPILMMSNQPQAQATPISFKDWINSIHLQHSSDYGNTWNDVQNGAIKKDDVVRFTITYDVPAYTLTDINRTITYDIPENLKLVKEASGDVHDKNGQDIGDYVITTDGHISITFHDAYVEKNKNGQIITGDITFESNAENIETNQAGSATINFNSQVVITIEKTNLVENTQDLQVQKTASNINNENGTVKYQIVVSSQNGTSEQITLHDEMRDGIGYNGSFVVTDQNGNTVYVNPPQTGASTFDLTLPALQAGGKYTITYEAKLNNELSGSKQINNTVTANSKDPSGLKIEDSSSAQANFSVNMIHKNGNPSQTEDVIYWTVYINQDRTNLNGYVFKDILSGTEYTGTVNLTDSSGNTKTVNLPYTFPSTNDAYTITYQTPKTKAAGSNNVINKAYLISPSGKEYSSEMQIYVPGEAYNPLKKSYTNLSYDETNKRFQIFWKLSIDNANSELTAPTVIKDRLESNQYFYKHQIQEVINQLNSSGLSYNIVIDDQYNFSQLTDNTKYKSFTITINQNVQKGTKIDINYSAFADNSNPNAYIDYVNTIKVNDFETQYITAKVAPVVNKYDVKNNSSDTTNNNYYGSEGTEDDGVIGWGMKINVPPTTTGSFIIEEVLPENVDLTNVKMDIDGKFSNTFTKDGNNWTSSANGYTINATLEGNVLRITVPENLNIQKQIYLEVTTKIKDTVDWTNETITFTNKVNIIDNGGNKIGSDEQTQNITKVSSPIGDYPDVINKTHKLETNQTDIIPYQIEINPEGANLVENSDFINLNDLMTYNGGYSIATISLVPNSLKVYKKEVDGTLTELSTSEYEYNYESIIPEGDNWLTCFNKLNMKIPDSTPLVIEYRYKIYGADKTNIYNIKNTASLIDFPTVPGQSSTIANITITHSSATATVKGLTVIKIDKNNNALTIPGVVFNLYEWNGSEYAPVTNKSGSLDFITNSDGELDLEMVKANVAYKLVEKTPAEGYIPTDDVYFMVSDSNTDKNPLIQPDDFNGTKIISGLPLKIENERPTTEVKVNKLWLDANGNALTTTPDNVNIQLWRYAAPKELVDFIPGFDADYKIEMIPAEGASWGNAKYKTYKTGAKIRVTLTAKQSFEGINPILKVNNEEITNLTPPDNDYTGSDIFTYEFIIKEPGEIYIITNQASTTNWSYNIEVIEENALDNIDLSQYKESNFYKDVNLSLANNWTYTWTNLPLLGKDSNGNDIYYVYYVEETNVYGYNTEISQEGTVFTVKNKKEGVSPSYTLPQTGGIGFYSYFIILIGIITFSFTILIKRKHMVKK